jgi:hypothetical protein
VDGPAAAKPAKLAVSKAGKAGKRSILPNIDLPESEMKFLEYRLQVVQSWPDSNRKRVILEGILCRLNRQGN